MINVLHADPTRLANGIEEAKAMLESTFIINGEPPMEETCIAYRIKNGKVQKYERPLTLSEKQDREVRRSLLRVTIPGKEKK